MASSVNIGLPDPPDYQISSQNEQLLSVSFGQSNGLVRANESKIARGYSVQDGFDHNALQAPTLSSEVPGPFFTEALSTSISEHPSPSNPFPLKPFAPSTDLALSQEKQLLLQENTFAIQTQTLTSDDCFSKDLSSPFHVPSIQRANIEVSDASSLVAPIRPTNGIVADRSQPIRCIPRVGSAADFDAYVAGPQNTLLPPAPVKPLSLQARQLEFVLHSDASRHPAVPPVQPDAIVSKPAAPDAHRSEIAGPDALYHVVQHRRPDHSKRLHNLLNDIMRSVSEYHKSPSDDTKAAYDRAVEKFVSEMGSELDLKKRPQFNGLNLNKDVHLKVNKEEQASQPSNGALAEQIYNFCNNPNEEEVESDTVFVMEKPLKEPQRKPELFDEPERRLYAPTAADLMSRAVSRPTMCETPAASTGSESYSRASRSSGGERRDALFQRLLGHKRPHPHCYTTGVYPASRQLEPCESYDSLKSERSNIRYLAKMVPLCETAGRRANPQEVLYPMLHPSRFFPHVFGVGFSADERRALFLSEFIEGETLEELRKSVKECVKRGNLMSREQEGLLLCDMILLLMRLRHDHVLNMDLKPENLILRSSPRGLVLVDHGFAVRTDSAEFETGTFELARGTPLYMTQELAEYAVRVMRQPEAAAEPTPLSLEDDQVGAALTLATVLLGEHPWELLLERVPVPPALAALRNDFFIANYKRTCVPADLLYQELQAKLNEAYRRRSISATARDVILALYQRKPLLEVAKLVPHCEMRDALH